jgi:sugar transferase (PEP-CTERM/EpsH1 system associated)
MHIVDNLGKGGLENGLVNLVGRLDADSFQHTVCAIRVLGPNAERLTAQGARVFCLNKQETDSPIQVATLARAIRRVKPHVVHSRNWAAIESVIAGRWVRSCAVVHSEHGLDAHTAVAEPWRRRWLRRLAFELADQVLSVSGRLRDLHANRTGFRAARITVIHNGVDSERFSPNSEIRARVRRELGFSENDFCIGCVGSLSAVKDYPTVLQAVGEMAKSSQNWRLLILGDGPERPGLEAFIRARPELNNRVYFQGLSDRVPELLNALDVYVLSSLIEGISNSLLEAMATGLPVVITATGGNPEVVVEEESGLLFPVGDYRQLSRHLLLLRSRGDLLRKLGQNALRRAREHFSINSMLQKYDEVYRAMAIRALLRGAARA